MGLIIWLSLSEDFWVGGFGDNIVLPVDSGTVRRIGLKLIGVLGDVCNNCLPFLPYNTHLLTLITLTVLIQIT